MHCDKVLSVYNLGDYNFDETKKNINTYFSRLEKLKWEWAKINAQRGLTANYDFASEYKRHPYIPAQKDAFSLSAKENKEEQLKKYLSSYYWAISILSGKERLYIEEYFFNQKYEDEVLDILGFDSRDNSEFRKLKKSAVYKFADFLNMVVEKNEGE